jgi:hypothetical protein
MNRQPEDVLTSDQLESLATNFLRKLTNLDKVSYDVVQKACNDFARLEYLQADQEKVTRFHLLGATASSSAGGIGVIDTSFLHDTSLDSVACGGRGTQEAESVDGVDVSWNLNSTQDNSVGGSIPTSLRQVPKSPLANAEGNLYQKQVGHYRKLRKLVSSMDLECLGLKMQMQKLSANSSKTESKMEENAENAENLEKVKLMLSRMARSLEKVEAEVKLRRGLLHLMHQIFYGADECDADMDVEFEANSAPMSDLSYEEQRKELKRIMLVWGERPFTRDLVTDD